ncbi:MAG: PepSY domain-containing protein [Proteobacteria bacterium]|nr:PepSY domain-containing protein [Pseudomonadota bacterium]MBS0495010.1 PepSY domain-containing protein [Pseudomonadota bacterium]
MKTIAPCLLALALGASVQPALADDDCDAPVAHWQPRDAVLRMAAEQGWQVQRLKIDDGCYEIRATDAQGRAFKARIDPQTLAIVKLKPHRERERRRGHD